MLFRRKMFRKYNKRSFFKIKVICIISIVAVAVSMADNAIKEIVSPMAMKNAEMLINIEVNKAISELLETVSPQFNEYISEYYSNNSIKSIESVNEDISLTEEMIETCKWMKHRYGITAGKVQHHNNACADRKYYR